MTAVAEVIKGFLSEAPVKIEGLVEALGVDLERKAELHSEIAGQIEQLPNKKFKISINKNDHYYRRRFTIAHELAHYILHKDIIGAGLDDTKAYRSLNIGKFNNQSVTSQHEVEANRLAAQLLMPSELVREWFQELNGDLEALSKKFQVSREAMGYRLKALKLSN